MSSAEAVLLQSEQELRGDPLINRLLTSIDEEKVRDYLVNDFLRSRGHSFDAAKTGPEGFLATRSYFRRKSCIGSAVISMPPTSAVTEMLYERRPATPVDEYFCGSKAGRAIANRFDAVVAVTSELIAAQLKEKEVVLVANLGSGPGRDTLRVLEQLDPKERARVRVVLLDNDQRALQEGAQAAKMLGMEGSFHFRYMDFAKATRRSADQIEEKFDIILLIGIVCPLSMRMSRNIVFRSSTLLNEEGVIVTSAAHKRMEEEDPFTDYIMRNLGGWSLEYKDEPGLQALLEETGFRDIRIHYDEPFHFHTIAVSRKGN